MKKFIAKAEAFMTITMIEDDREIGFYQLKNPIIEIEAESIEDAMAADMNDWEVIDEAGGYYETDEVYDDYDVDYSNAIIEEIYDIEEDEE